ncbi:MAG: hypothetical protein WCT18_00720 [Patescibacteria group bacterium]
MSDEKINKLKQILEAISEKELRKEEISKKRAEIKSEIDKLNEELQQLSSGMLLDLELSNDLNDFQKMFLQVAQMYFSLNIFCYDKQPEKICIRIKKKSIATDKSITQEIEKEEPSADDLLIYSRLDNGEWNPEYYEMVFESVLNVERFDAIDFLKKHNLLPDDCKAFIFQLLPRDTSSGLLARRDKKILFFKNNNEWIKKIIFD